MRTGLLHKGGGRSSAFYGTTFHVWRMYIKDGYIRLAFRSNDNRFCAWTSPYDAWLKRDKTFNDPKDWDQLEEEFKVLYERQKKLHPAEHKEQKSRAIKDINYKRKMWPGIMKEDVTREWTERILAFARKRS